MEVTVVLLVIVAAGWGAATTGSVTAPIPGIGVTSEGRWISVCRLSVVVSGWWGASGVGVSKVRVPA